MTTKRIYVCYGSAMGCDLFLSPSHILSQNQTLFRHGRITDGLLIIPLNPFKALFLGDRTRFFQTFSGWVTFMKVVAFWGMCCGYLLMPFWTFFIATSLGPCLCHFVCRFDVAGSSFRENAMCAFFYSEVQVYTWFRCHSQVTTLKHITTSCRVKTKEK